MPRKKGAEQGKWRSLKTGKFVSSYYAKRNPTRVVEVSASERAREIQEKLKAEGRTFSDSADLIHWQRLGLTPEEVGRIVAEGELEVSEDAIEFFERFNKQYRETLKRLADS